MKKQLIFLALIFMCAFGLQAQKLTVPKNSTYIEYNKAIVIDSTNLKMTIEAPQHYSTLQKVFISVDTVNAFNTKIYLTLKGKIFENDNWAIVAKDSVTISTLKSYELTCAELSTANLYRIFELEVKGDNNKGLLKLTKVAFKQWLK